MAWQPVERGVLVLRCRYHDLRHVWIAAAMTDKYCKDCRHNVALDYCQAPQLLECVPKFDLVRGARQATERRGVSSVCLVLRHNENECGRDARWFEQRKSTEVAKRKPWWRAWG
jgi:hypothetical protein